MKRMTLYIPTGDAVVYPYWGRCGRVWRCMSLLEYPNVDLYWGRCGREWGNRSLLGTQWWGMVL